MNFMKLLRKNDQYFDDEVSVTFRGTTSPFTHVTTEAIRSRDIKARIGRGRKKAPWTAGIYIHELLYFDIFSSPGSDS